MNYDMGKQTKKIKLYLNFDQRNQIIMKIMTNFDFFCQTYHNRFSGYI